MLPPQTNQQLRSPAIIGTSSAIIPFYTLHPLVAAPLCSPLLLYQACALVAVLSPDP
ncbi:hypothetical protein SLEP1_g26117 [Rubroshorea leprosula]|uniref:Uncharacterized protein n=1 Tax=Rubroshorea leprosula TaxID=152421 RepID=A0AAV5JT65_9ROSI|nr:hypothetical protein SLEP1_g26117 [Rubroshorea leprosula]